MTTATKILLPEGLRHEHAPSTLSASDKAKHHTRQLRGIAFHQGTEGVARYKRQHPEAAPIRVNLTAIAYRMKPKGYDDYLTNLAGLWLTSDEAAASSNMADVQRLNSHFGGDRFNPANHFSKPLSPGRLEKLKAVFLSHGVHIDPSKANTLSKVKQAARASRNRQSADRPFCGVGVIAGNVLVIGGRSFGIEQHHGHDCVRVPVAGARLRLRLDALTAVLGGLGAEDDPLSQTTTCSIGELAPRPESPNFDPLAAADMGELAPASLLLPIGETAPAAAPLSLTERIAALTAARPAHSTACADGTDPLASAPIDIGFLG